MNLLQSEESGLRIGIVSNQLKDNCRNLAEEIEEWFKQRGAEVLSNTMTPSTLPDIKLQESGIEYNHELDGVVVLGGDGTLLRTARRLASKGIPLLGVNLGRLGFLTELEKRELYQGLEAFLSGGYRIEERMMMETRVWRGSEVIDASRALNDVVIHRGTLARIISVEAYIDGHYFTTYEGDGVIVSTPTGSTAYSLSAGGPIVSPTAPVMLVTPICPHSFYSRPLVISNEQRIRIITQPGFDEVMLTIDGQHGIHLKAGDEIDISRSSVSTRLIKLSGRHFFDVLREKLTQNDPLGLE